MFCYSFVLVLQMAESETPVTGGLGGTDMNRHELQVSTNSGSSSFCAFTLLFSRAGISSSLLHIVTLSEKLF